MAAKIFVNYRRDDERAVAARVRDRLAQTLGDTNVFMDVDNLLAGQRFDKELEKALAQTDVFLAVIGPRWLQLLAERQASGERDYVHEEIAGALRRGIIVIPVMVERTPLPRGDTLPEDIRDLVLHQKHVITHEQFGRDVAGLVQAIRFATKAVRGKAERSRVALKLSAGALAAAGMAALAVVLVYDLGRPIHWLRGNGERQSEQAAKAKETAARAELEAKAAQEAERQRQDIIKGVEDAKAEGKRKAEQAIRTIAPSPSAVQQLTEATVRARLGVEVKQSSNAGWLSIATFREPEIQLHDAGFQLTMFYNGIDDQEWPATRITDVLAAEICGRVRSGATNGLLDRLYQSKSLVPEVDLGGNAGSSFKKQIMGTVGSCRIEIVAQGARWHTVTIRVRR